MTHVTCRLTAKNRDWLRNPTLGSRVWATFTFFSMTRSVCVVQASSSEVMVLRASRRYDPETDTVVFGDGSPFSPSSLTLSHGGLSEFVNAMFEFSRGMASLGVDNAEYALLISLCIFSCELRLSSPMLTLHLI